MRGCIFLPVVVTAVVIYTKHQYNKPFSFNIRPFRLFSILHGTPTQPSFHPSALDNIALKHNGLRATEYAPTTQVCQEEPLYTGLMQVRQGHSFPSLQRADDTEDNKVQL